MKIKYRDIHLSKTSLIMLDRINDIIEEYQGMSLILTLRQLYYQLVSRDIIANKQAEYHKLSRLLKEGRMSGVVDWAAIADRLRVVETASGWLSGKSILNTAARSYEYRRQDNQDKHIEIWVEKDAISEIVERICNEYHIPVMVNRGYSSVSAMHDAYQRFEDETDVTILYLGDHDPSGLHMIEDIENRILEFREGAGTKFKFKIVPIALTTAQIKRYSPPPNPAKMTDPRAAEYVKMHGRVSWEVDALRPEVLNDLIKKEIEKRLDMDEFKRGLKIEAKEKQKLKDFIATYDDFHS